MPVSLLRLPLSLDNISQTFLLQRMKAKLDISQDEFLARKRARIEKMRQPAREFRTPRRLR
jgi:hypothetical protein